MLSAVGGVRIGGVGETVGGGSIGLGVANHKKSISQIPNNSTNKLNSNNNILNKIVKRHVASVACSSNLF